MTAVNNSASKQYVSVAHCNVPHGGLKCGKSPAPFYHRVRVSGLLILAPGASLGLTGQCANNSCRASTESEQNSLLLFSGVVPVVYFCVTNCPKV